MSYSASRKVLYQTKTHECHLRHLPFDSNSYFKPNPTLAALSPTLIESSLSKPSGLLELVVVL